ncbi:MAG: hypothetical protein ACI4R9_07775 [Kiritimatiellia bacterium]
MTGLEYILDGLEAALALERELGVRTVEIDRGLLAVAAAPSAPARQEAVSGVPRPTPGPRPPAAPRAPRPAPGADLLAIAFLHDRPLSPAGCEMMAKIVAALKLTEAQAKVVTAPPLPSAKAYVVLGGRALRKWFPGRNGAPGWWIRTEDGRDVLITNSPEYILRFKTVTPELKRCKESMWRSIKSVMTRIGE